jgi:hypothetical protein
VNKKKIQSLYKELAHKLQDGIENSLSKGQKAAVRWIWELIQNAKDSTSGDRHVMVEIEITDN